ncbi:hypothetical protein [Dactylosporangium sp. CA-233914]|uniref:hypothetical protein n=1 Tax=Dactylosporangium sp. CA-233914 TaxID=3239934 RepID=UPI003D8A9113
MTPQEKKALSYERDHRNTYGENDKGSRRSIRRNKRHVNRANRHRARQAFKGADPQVGQERLGAERPKRWRKCADVPLAEYVAYKLRRRVQRGIIDPRLAEARIERIARTRQVRSATATRVA